VKEWSQRFADLRFYLTYNVEGLWDAGVYEFVNGHSGLRDHHVGWFRMAKDGEPVHHYVVCFEDDNPADMVKIKRLADAKLIFRPSDSGADQFKGAWAFRCQPEDLLKEGVRFAYDPMPYTLDEEVYLESVWNRAMDQARSEAHLCRCPVKLTDDERQSLEGAVAGEPEDVRAAVRSDQSLDLYETRDQLAALLKADFLTEVRREEIRAAMQHPGWTKDWPQWEAVMATPRQTRRQVRRP
jgi:hypothetical protein